MIVITGPMRVVSRPSASRRSSPRCTASAAATACATLNETVALMLTPRAVASSMAATPARVAGSFTMTFGARPSNSDACATRASASRHSVGSVWIESRPARPPDAAKAGMSSGAARWLISATIAQATSRSDQVECSPASTRARVAQWEGSARQLSTTIVGLAVAPVAPNSTAYASSSRLLLSFQISVAVSAIVRPSGVPARAMDTVAMLVM